MTNEAESLLQQVEFVLTATAPFTPQQAEAWPELKRRAEAARAALSQPSPAVPVFWVPSFSVQHWRKFGCSDRSMMHVSAICSEIHDMPVYAAPQPTEQPGDATGLQWSESLPPDGKRSSYDHCYAETPLGTLMAEWKGWKANWDLGMTVALGESPMYHEPADDLEDAKRRGEAHLRKIAHEILAVVGPAARAAHGKGGQG